MPYFLPQREVCVRIGHRAPQGGAQLQTPGRTQKQGCLLSELVPGHTQYSLSLSSTPILNFPHPLTAFRLAQVNCLVEKPRPLGPLFSQLWWVAVAVIPVVIIEHEVVRSAQINALSSRNSIYYPLVQKQPQLLILIRTDYQTSAINLSFASWSPVARQKTGQVISTIPNLEDSVLQERSYSCHMTSQMSPS